MTYIKIKKRRGPKLEPCGTPHTIALGFEFTLFMQCKLAVYLKHKFIYTRPDTGYT